MIVRRFLFPALLALAVIASTAAAQSGDVTVELDQFGVGSWFRPGGITAIRLKLTSLLDEPTQCWVQWEVPNAEGDPAEYGRSLTLTPGTPAFVWLYATLPAKTGMGDTWTVRVFEEREDDRRGELGGTRISPSLVSAQRAGAEVGMIAVVGRAVMKLDDYRNPLPQQANPPGAHEQTLIVGGIRPDRLPDRWDGLRAFEAVVWSDALPQELRASTAAALAEYVRRGGHLIIALPSAGNPWALGRGGVTDLDPLFPQHAPRKDEAVPITKLLPIISKSDRALRDFEVSIRVFKEIGSTFDVLDNHYEPLIALPDGRVVVIQRTYGHGRITIIGLDLASQRLASMGLPEADVLWNRVLGRRSDTPRARQLKGMEDQDRLARPIRDHRRIGDGRLLADQLSKTGNPGTGILAAFVLFIAYFLLAGPLGFFALKQQGLTRHSWLVFSATAALFTAVAWAGVGLLREHSIELKHVTVLDYVARPADDQRPDELHLQRATGWFSLYVPSYGTARVSIDSDPAQRDLLLTWSAPEQDPQRFPNVAPYRVDVAKTPADYRIPARASVSQMYASWLGALDPQWGGMIRVDPNDPLRVQRDARGERDERLVGSLSHDLPGNLENVLIVWVTNNRLARRRWAKDSDTELAWVPALQSGKALNIGHMWAIGPWGPQTPLSFSTAKMKPSGQTGFERNTLERYIRTYAGKSGIGVPGSQTPLRDDAVRRHFEMLSFFHQITPPRYHRQGGRDPQKNLVLTRLLGRELDLSAWLTRPCLIVVGWLPDSQCPIPLRVDGDPPNSSGLTIVRWIYPLPLAQEELTNKPSEE
ncbi:MAG: hypothetical protein V3T84_16360 [Phycisphaerales bacterium]